MAAEDEPSPRACGIRLRHDRRRPGGCSPISVEGRPHRPDDQVRLVAGHAVGARTLDLDEEPVGHDLGLELVTQRQRQAEGVEAGPEVGRGGGDA